MMGRMDERTFRRWQLFEQVEPFGQRVLNLMLARIAAAAAQSAAVEEFLPRMRSE